MKTAFYSRLAILGLGIWGMTLPLHAQQGEITKITFSKDGKTIEQSNQVDAQTIEQFKKTSNTRQAPPPMPPTPPTPPQLDKTALKAEIMREVSDVLQIENGVVELNISDLDELIEGNIDLDIEFDDDFFESLDKDDLKALKKSLGEDLTIARTTNGIRIYNGKDHKTTPKPYLGLYHTKGKLSGIIRNTPADKAGLKTGDVLLEIDGARINSTHLTTAIRAHKPGQTVDLKYIRDGKPGEIRFTFERHPEGAAEMPYMGIYSTKHYISRIVKDGPAARQGLQAGDELVQIGNMTLGGESLSKVLNRYEVGDEISIKLRRNGKVLTKRLVLGARDQYTSFRTSESISDCIVDCATTPFLGIEYNPNGAADISRIIEATAAEQGALQAGDRILSINTFKIFDATDLHDAIFAHKPGDAVQITYHRQGQTQTAQIIMGSMESHPTQNCCTEEDSLLKTQENIETVKDTIKTPQENIENIPPVVEQVTTPLIHTEEVPYVELEAFPNPTNDILQVQYIGTEMPLTVEIFDPMGRRLYEEHIAHFQGAYNTPIDLSSFAAGMYILRMQQGAQQISRQIIKK